MNTTIFDLEGTAEPEHKAVDGPLVPVRPGESAVAGKGKGKSCGNLVHERSALLTELYGVATTDDDDDTEVVSSQKSSLPPDLSELGPRSASVVFRGGIGLPARNYYDAMAVEQVAEELKAMARILEFRAMRLRRARPVSPMTSDRVKWFGHKE